MSGSNVKNTHYGLFPEFAHEETDSYTTGILPSQAIRELIRTKRISADAAITEDQIQPASIDLRLGPIAYRVQASFLPGRFSTVETRIDELKVAEVDLSRPALFEKGGVYIVPLMEQLNLPSDVLARANPRSTTGRLDIFTRLIADFGVEFEYVPPGYKGRVYVEIVSRTFAVVVCSGMKLNQIRFVRGNPSPSDSMISTLDKEEALVYLDGNIPAKAMINKGLRVSVNLEKDGSSDIIAYKAKKNSPVIDLSKINYYSPEEYWEPRFSPRNKSIILEPGDFYVLASKERIRVPPDVAAEMVPFDPSIGEFRIHYAGFFDPGFGYGVNDIKGTPAVLEVRAHEVPFLMEDGQIVARLMYMRLLSRPDKVYGVEIGSSYQHQALALSKQFKREL